MVRLSGSIARISTLPYAGTPRTVQIQAEQVKHVAGRDRNRVVGHVVVGLGRPDRIERRSV